jgi:hypothetical protein
MMAPHSLEFRPLSTANWVDLLELFEGHGNPGYCWRTPGASPVANIELWQARVANES